MAERGNKFHTEFIIQPDDVSKEIDVVRNLTESVDILCQQIGSRNQAKC